MVESMSERGRIRKNGTEIPPVVDEQHDTHLAWAEGTSSGSTSPMNKSSTRIQSKTLPFWIKYFAAVFAGIDSDGVAVIYAINISFIY